MIQMALKALLLTVLVSFFFLVGILLPSFFKNKNKLILFTTSLTFVVMLFLLFFDLFPEVIEIFTPFSLKSLALLLIFGLFGFVMLKILDYFVPEHHHEHHDENDDEKEHSAHLYHIGFITALSLIIHNILEGISIYITGLTDCKLGLIMALSVGFHNLPLGIEIAVGLSAKKEHKFTKGVLLILVVLSSFLGAFFLFLLGKELVPILEGILLSMTIGMIVYISFCELLREMIENRHQKEIYYGFFVGLILSFVLLLF